MSGEKKQHMQPEQVAALLATTIHRAREYRDSVVKLLEACNCNEQQSGGIDFDRKSARKLTTLAIEGVETALHGAEIHGALCKGLQHVQRTFWPRGGLRDSEQAYETAMKAAKASCACRGCLKARVNATGGAS